MKDRLFIMLIGIPGSGKSTLAETLARNYNAVLISTDQLRFQYTGSEENRTKDNCVFATVQKCITKYSRQPWRKDGMRSQLFVIESN